MCIGGAPQEPQREIRPQDRATYLSSLSPEERYRVNRMPTKSDTFKMSHPEQFPDIFKEWAPQAAPSAAGAPLTAPTGVQRRKPRSLLGLAGGGAGDNSMADIGGTAAKAVLGA